ncbi:MAG: hypothetical protein UU21_C0019G0002 [Candidatus Levybacteria bacterium GW2011_GWA2_40_8]|nr:MAG: hypothetical protein UU21_C0019G0002 [Candidatus Levybacteria bacterium GW2011_GWA2_40_8]
MIKNKPLIIVSLALTILIIISIGLILSLDNNAKNSSDLKNLDKIKNDIQTVSSSGNALQNPVYQKFLAKFNEINNSKLNKEQKYEVLNTSLTYLVSYYSLTNDPQIFDLEEKINSFIILNFPEKKTTLEPSCFDPSCADSPQSPEMLAIIEVIKNSNVPSPMKDDNIKDLTNFGYLQTSRNNSKVQNYLIMASMIEKNQDYQAAGINIKVANDIRSYVKKAYPALYDKYGP